MVLLEEVWVSAQGPVVSLPTLGLDPYTAEDAERAHGLMESLTKQMNDYGQRNLP